MEKLQLNFLGDLAVIRDGEAIALPPSKKTRALLAYLVLNNRTFRREHLCELLWEIPDDPRGSLRWSLSKLRRLVDDDGHARILADRAGVGLDTSDVQIDVAALLALADRLEQASVEELATAADNWCGNFLEGLELANFLDFHSWCVVQRERIARAQAAVLGKLIERLPAQQALTHARTLVTITPYDESARAVLITLLMASGRPDEAEQQFRLGMRLLKEIGAASSGALYQAWRGASGQSPAAAANGGSVAPLTAVATEQVLVGRDSEIAALQAGFNDVLQNRRARLILLQGEPGIGKTRLLQTVAVVAGQAGAFCLQANAYESEVLRPFAVWIDALRELPAEQAPAIFDSDNINNRDRLFESLSAFISGVAEQRPVLLLFDDVQWCDESSVAALHYVARVNSKRPLYAVLTARSGEIRDNSAVVQVLRSLRRDKLLEEVKLGPLPEDAVRQLIQRQAPQVDSDALTRECGGNPLLAIELARAESIGEGGASLDELIRERLSRFDLDSAEVLRWAAVLAPHIEVPMLTKVTGMDSGRIGQALELAEQQAMLRLTERGLQFRHDLIGRAIYTDISPSRRRVMHRRVAEMLDVGMDRERAADLAHHAAQSGDPALAARAMVSAGRLCLRFFANDDALALSRKGLQFAEQLSGAERVCLILELKDIMLTAAPLQDWRRAAEEFARLAEQALDCGERAHARLGYHMASYVRWEHGHWSGAREESLQAERVARGGSEEEHIVGMAETAKCLALLERDLNQADAMLMEARALAERRRFNHHALAEGLAMLRYHENRLDEAEELFREALALCKSAGERLSEFSIQECLTMLDFQRGDLHSALQRCEILLELGEKLREGSEAPFALCMQGLCRFALEDISDPLDSALDALRTADAKYRLSYILTRAALLDLQRGRPADAGRRAAEALDYAQVLERATEMALAHLVLAQAYMADGDEARSAVHRDSLQQLSGAPVARWAKLQIAQLNPAQPAEG